MEKQRKYFGKLTWQPVSTLAYIPGTNGTFEHEKVVCGTWWYSGKSIPGIPGILLKSCSFLFGFLLINIGFFCATIGW